ncbi:hypothetical protein Tco_0400833 [Tanacetum coccineum]
MVKVVGQIGWCQPLCGRKTLHFKFALVCFFTFAKMEQREAKGEARSTKEPVQADIWYRNLPVKLKCAEKLSSMIWEEKHEHDGPRQNLNADNAYHIRAFLDVPIVQELNSTGTIILHIRLSQMKVSLYYSFEQPTSSPLGSEPKGYVDNDLGAN